jgi:hypothetical protein
MGVEKRMALIVFPLMIGVLGACTEPSKGDSAAQELAEEILPEGSQEGDCSDGFDNDQDGMIDCGDSSCRDEPSCSQEDSDPEQGGNEGSGEQCAISAEDIFLSEGVESTSLAVTLTGACLESTELFFSLSSPNTDWREVVPASEHFVPQLAPDEGYYNHLIIKDLDRDNDLDFVVAVTGAEGSAHFAWYEQESAEQLIRHELLTESTAFFDLEVVDLNGDSDLDLVTTGSNGVVVYDNDGDPNPTFTPTTIISEEAGVCMSSAVADLNEDGHLDIICAAPHESYDLSWYQNDGQELPQFTMIPVEDEQHALVDLKVADFNGDGALDIVTASWVGHHHNWYQGTGGATPLFTKQAIDVSGMGVFVWDEPSSSELLDIDGDGDLDLISTSVNTLSNHSLIWYENDGGTSPTLTFHEHPEMYFSAAPVEAGDLDGDGDLDFLAHLTEEGTLMWHEQTVSALSFVSHPLPISAPFFAKELQDIDGDLDLDVVLLTAEENSILFLENNLQLNGQNIAVQGVDYQESSGILAFSEAHRTMSIELVVHEDSDVEGDEQFFVDLSAPDSSELSPLQTTVTILDND